MQENDGNTKFKLVNVCIYIHPTVGKELADELKQIVLKLGAKRVINEHVATHILHPYDNTLSEATNKVFPKDRRIRNALEISAKWLIDCGKQQKKLPVVGYVKHLCNLKTNKTSKVRNKQKRIPNKSSTITKKHKNKQLPIKSQMSNTNWTELELIRLFAAVEKYPKDWNKVSKYVESHTAHECAIQFIKMPIIDPYLEEDDKIVNDLIAELKLKLNSGIKQLTTIKNSLHHTHSYNHTLKEIVSVTNAIDPELQAVVNVQYNVDTLLLATNMREYRCKNRKMGKQIENVILEIINNVIKLLRGKLQECEVVVQMALDETMIANNRWKMFTMEDLNRSGVV